MEEELEDTIVKEESQDSLMEEELKDTMNELTLKKKKYEEYKELTDDIRFLAGIDDYGLGLDKY
jgi:hypothetical protein